MAPSPHATLRPILATATFAVVFGGFVGVGAAQDAGAYRGPLLSWTGKSPPPTDAPAPASAPAPAPAAAPPDDGAATYVAPRRAAPVVEAAPERAPPPAEPQPAPAAYRPPPAPEAAPPPTVAESAPAPYIAPPAPAKPARRTRLAAAAAAHPVTAPAAAPDTAAAPTQSAEASVPAASPRTHVRFYSLHRAYGMTPDPIAMPTQRTMVLVGPPDAAASQSQNGGDDAAADAGKPAPHGDGQGAGGAADPSGN
jgi:hypothetical protein